MTDEIRKITLHRPFEGLEGETITEIYLKEPKAGHLRKIDGQGAEMICQFVELCGGQTEACGGLPRPLVNRISARDFTEISKVAADFFGISPETLET